ncbi:MAG TPA: acyl-CoA thioesterase II [Actinomycetaceae bacterium]|nr:acyl-CoA thioesterase II [Actinomycetaceae bacterium]
MTTPAPAPPPSYLPLPQLDLRPLDQVLAILHLEERGEHDFIGHSLPGPMGRVYGGQVMAQALVAAARTMPEDTQRCPHSMHGYFLRMGQLGTPIEFAVEALHDGGSFSRRRVTASQGERTIMTLTASFQENQPGVEFAEAMPEAPAPEGLSSNRKLFTGSPHPAAAAMALHYGAFDMRHADGHVYFRNGDAAAGNTQQVWMRANQPLPDNTPQILHRALLAYSCDQVMLEPVLRSTGLSWTSPGLSVASLDHSMWFHRHLDVRDWLLYAQDSPSSQGGRGLGRASVFDRRGRLVASIAQEGMIRVPLDEGTAGDDDGAAVGDDGSGAGKPGGGEPG